MSIYKTDTVCDLCRLTDDGIVCDADGHGTRRFIEMTDGDVRRLVQEIFYLRDLLVEQGASKEPPTELTEELVALESAIIGQRASDDEKARYKELVVINERYRRPEFQRHLLENSAHLFALVWECRRDHGK